MLHFDSSQPIVTRGPRDLYSPVSRAPPHHTLPAFLNLNSSLKVIESVTQVPI